MNNKNAEGYPDPTATTAMANLTRLEKMRMYSPLVYIASPYEGDTENNLARARGYCRFAVNRGFIPIAPHLHYPQFMDDGDVEDRELGLYFALVLLGKCDELWAFGDRISDGTVNEIAKAKKRGIPIKYFNIKCEEVITDGRTD